MNKLAAAVLLSGAVIGLTACQTNQPDVAVEAPKPQLNNQDLYAALMLTVFFSAALG